MSRKVVVVGGGIAGLAIAYELVERSERLDAAIDVVCLEASPRPGGNIRSDREAGFLFEWAANGFLDNAPATVTLLRRIGLERHVIASRPSAERRFIYRRRALREVPTTPAAFLRSDVLPWYGRLRLLAEPLIPPRRAPGDESIHEFASRRIGGLAARVLVGAMVSGIYAGDTRRLSLRSTFPKMYAMEHDHGGLFRAMIARRRLSAARGETMGGPAGPGGRLTSFVDGMQTLSDGLAEKLGERLRLDAPVVRLSRVGKRLRVHPRKGESIDADAVVVACPGWNAGPVVAPLDDGLGRALSETVSAPVTVCHLGYRRSPTPGRDAGFGFLVPRGEGPRILGALWASDIFDQRAPQGGKLITVMTGGAYDPETAALDDAPLIDLVRRDLAVTMGLDAAPDVVKVLRHPRGIPQYVVGHDDRMRTIEARLNELPGLFLGGNSYRGVAINACIAEAPEIAEAVLDHVSVLEDRR